MLRTARTVETIPKIPQELVIKFFNAVDFDCAEEITFEKMMAFVLKHNVEELTEPIVRELFDRTRQIGQKKKTITLKDVQRVFSVRRKILTEGGWCEQCYQERELWIRMLLRLFPKPFIRLASFTAREPVQPIQDKREVHLDEMAKIEQRLQTTQKRNKEILSARTVHNVKSTGRTLDFATTIEMQEEAKARAAAETEASQDVEMSAEERERAEREAKEEEYRQLIEIMHKVPNQHDAMTACSFRDKALFEVKMDHLNEDRNFTLNVNVDQLIIPTPETSYENTKIPKGKIQKYEDLKAEYMELTKPNSVPEALDRKRTEEQTDEHFLKYNAKGTGKHGPTLTGRMENFNWSTDFLNRINNQMKKSEAAVINQEFTQSPFKNPSRLTTRQIAEQELRDPWRYAKGTDVDEIESKKKIFQMLARKRFTIYDLDAETPNYNAFTEVKPPHRPKDSPQTSPKARPRAATTEGKPKPKPPNTSRPASHTTNYTENIMNNSLTLSDPGSRPYTTKVSSSATPRPPDSSRPTTTTFSTTAAAPHTHHMGSITERGTSSTRGTRGSTQRTQHPLGKFQVYIQELKKTADLGELGDDVPSGNARERARENARKYREAREKDFKLRHNPLDGTKNLDGDSFLKHKYKRINPMAEFVNARVKSEVNKQVKQIESENAPNPEWIAIPAGLDALDPNPLGTIDHLLVLKHRESHRYIMGH